MVRRTLVLCSLEARTLKNLKRTSINVLGFHHPTETERERKRRRKRKSVVRRTLVLRSLETGTQTASSERASTFCFFITPQGKGERKYVVRRTLMLPSFETRTLNSLKQTSIIVLVFIIPQCQTEKKNAVRRTIMLRLSKARTHLPQTNAYTNSFLSSPHKRRRRRGRGGGKEMCGQKNLSAAIYKRQEPICLKRTSTFCVLIIPHCTRKRLRLLPENGEEDRGGSSRKKRSAPAANLKPQRSKGNQM